jgi:hypothetical protein
MTKLKQAAASARIGLVAVAVISLLLYFAAASSIAGASRAESRGGPSALTLNEPRAEEEIWEEEGWDERNSEEGEAEETEEETEESSPPPEECNLYAMTTRLVASDRNDTVHLTVRYEAGEATDVKVEYWLKGARGSFQLKPLGRQMSTRGTIQGSQRLSAREMAKVSAARVFVVYLEILGLPRYCESYFTRRLTAKHESGSRAVWSEPPVGTQPVG